jgi:hypothetical protein
MVVNKVEVEVEVYVIIFIPTALPVLTLNILKQEFHHLSDWNIFAFKRHWHNHTIELK